MTAIRDAERLERRKHSLARWLRETAQAALAGIFADELERSEAAAASAAWNKLLLVHLSVLLLSYLPPRRLP